MPSATYLPTYLPTSGVCPRVRARTTARPRCAAGRPPARLRRPAGPRRPGAEAGQTAEAEVLLNVWQEICDTEREMLERFTLADLVEQSRSRDENMFYI